MLRPDSPRALLLHITLIATLGTASVLLFFYLYLPMTTNHGETITVPDVRGVKLTDLDDFLEVRNLRYEVTADSGFSVDVPPLAVLKQFPAPNSKVKENRKIYVSLNAEKPPLVRMPKLAGTSVKNAQLILKTYDLKLGQIRYVPDLALNFILQQRVDGREVLEGERIPKGSLIDLVVGDGLGNQQLTSPNLIGLDEESAQFAIIGSGLKVGDILYDQSNFAVIEMEDSEGNIVASEQKVSPGAVNRQEPPPGGEMRLGQIVNIWIYKPDSVNLNPTLLDQE